MTGACPAGCRDGKCDSGEETCTSCPADCGACPPACGDGKCDATETCKTCAADCGACPPMCGDKTCNGTETCTSCPADCGACSSDGGAADQTPVGKDTGPDSGVKPDGAPPGSVLPPDRGRSGNPV